MPGGAFYSTKIWGAYAHAPPHVPPLPPTLKYIPSSIKIQEITNDTHKSNRSYVIGEHNAKLAILLLGKIS
jgi:hypothetical protein